MILSKKEKSESEKELEQQLKEAPTRHLKRLRENNIGAP